MSQRQGQKYMVASAHFLVQQRIAQRIGKVIRVHAQFESIMHTSMYLKNCLDLIY